MDGPRRIRTRGRTIEPLRRITADEQHFLAVQFIDGHTEHLAGPTELFIDPTQHAKINKEQATALDAGVALLLYTRGDDGEVTWEVVRGPARIVPGPNQWLRPLPLHTAGEDEYLAIRFRDGRTEHRPGPTAIHEDPVEHEAVEVHQALPISTHEAVVVYGRDAEGRVNRRVLRGPAQFVPASNEWLHEFRWHGADPKNPRVKVPRALRFNRLRVIPDQMYVDVEDVRTADDALIAVKLMLFFELTDIERMLDQTHDPVADFLNAVTADVIDFAATLNFEQFKARTEQLNELEAYPNLTNRAERIGYRVNKLVYRGYEASNKLQVMHDDAIEARTRLKLEGETERQAQELADLKLEREGQRDAMRREMQREQAEHTRQLEREAHTENLRQRAEEAEQQATGQRLINEVELDHIKAKDTQQAALLGQMQAMQIDVTRYLVAQYQNPDRLVRIEGGGTPPVHLHEPG
ncbi:hypothetical protein [Algisphaera agarilytica]|uniref:Band 7 domain-containing protein n=1 Tax=Algisphaera agarilytica TaxID=1385975 RepID=A0A7X0LKG6_9BACT|nr:hypothetical protein [Algisphaera agarilytica]MBB6428928.1 hypothetical protein [Algisphaera agarilytica]